MKHLMIDLETMGTRFDAPVMAVGAVFFDPDTGTLGKKFYGSIDPADAFRHGKPSGDTVRWWMKQGDDARLAAIGGKHKLDFVLTKFRDYYLAGGDDVCVWSNGATFDISILEYAFPKVLGEAAPWAFWLVRDCRTIKALAQGMVKETKLQGTAHNALDDAVNQANWVSEMWMVLRGKKPVPPPKTMISEDLLS